MALSLDFSIDNPISPEDLLTLALQEPQMKLPQDSPRRRWKHSKGLLPTVEAHMILPNFDFLITAFAEEERGREITYECSQVAPRVNISIQYGASVSEDEFLRLFAYLLKQLEGDALLIFAGVSPILRRKDGVIMTQQGTGYYADAAVRALLPPPVIEGKIPW